MAPTQAIPAIVEPLMPGLKSDLMRLVGIPSVSAPGFPQETWPPLLEAHEATVELLRNAGVHSLRSLELPDTAPVILGEVPPPTVLLYGHYDVAPWGGRVEVGDPSVRGKRA